MAARAFYVMSGFWQVLVHYLISILMTCQWTGGYVLCCKVEIITKIIVIVFLFVSSKFESSNKQCLSIKGCIIQCYIWCNMWLQKLLIYTVFLFFFSSHFWIFLYEYLSDLTLSHILYATNFLLNVSRENRIFKKISKLIKGSILVSFFSIKSLEILLVKRK